MSFADELAALYYRDLTRLIQELTAFEDEAAVWSRTGGVSNSVGNLALHLEGNLREYIGRQLGGISFSRKRDLEFSTTGVPVQELISRVTEVRDLVPRIISALDAAILEAEYPEKVLGAPMSTRQFLLHLFGHFNYHLGQIDYLRRVVTGQGAVSFAGL